MDAAMRRNRADLCDYMGAPQNWMMYDNAIVLLQKHGARIIRGESGWFVTAHLNGHELQFHKNRWSKQMMWVRFYLTDPVTGKNRSGRHRLKSPGGNIHNGTFLKRFIQVAASKCWMLSGDEVVQYGPDSTHKKLAPSARICK
mgnify:CR=1 FL=1